MTDKVFRNFNILSFRKNLIDWYNSNRRDLPWRQTKDPYKIWVSEIMLQQTKVDTVIDYYENFIKRYPTVFHLAEAADEEVLKQWEGLGYYSRARNLHEAAREVATKYEGKVPDDVQTLSKLKGIGPYTRGAILSIAFQQPEPAVDGNVMRVLSRILHITDDISKQKTRQRFEDFVRILIDPDDPSAFNQALMELGALICTPRGAKCESCPVQQYCRAYEKQTVDRLPVKAKAKKQTVIPYATFIVENEAGKIAIEQRKSEGLLANMWQFPMLEIKKHTEVTLLDDWMEEYKGTIEIDEKLGNIKHVFSHLIWEITVYRASLNSNETKMEGLTFVPKAELANYPISVAHQKVIRLLTD